MNFRVPPPQVQPTPAATWVALMVTSPTGYGSWGWAATMTTLNNRTAAMAKFIKIIFFRICCVLSLKS